MSTKKVMIAETLGTAWLVLGGCGTAIFAGLHPETGIGALGVALAFGFALASAFFAFGSISGGHFNPAVTLGLWAAGKFCPGRAVSYIIAQVLGALIGAAVIYQIAQGHAGFDVTAGFGASGFGDHSPAGYGQTPAFIAEAVLAFFFVTIFLHVGNSGMMAAMPIGLSYVVAQLVGMTITGGAINPARAASQAVFQGGWAQDQLWLFVLAPVVGAVAAGWLKKSLCCGSCGTEKTACDAGSKTSCHGK